MTIDQPTAAPGFTTPSPEGSNHTLRYALYGTLFGCSFPIGATAVDAFAIRGLGLSWAVLVMVHSEQPLHWILDTAPLFLGLFASLAGRRQGRSTLQPRGGLPMAWRSAVTEALETRTHQEIESVGGDRIFSLIFAPMPDLAYVNVYGLNISERKRAQLELEDAKEAAESASVGIPDDIRDEVFQPFRQGEVGANKGGSGLGLTIARRHVEMMGGFLALASRPTAGTRLFFSLHLPPGEPTQHSHMPVSSPAPDWKRVIGIRRPASVRALVVDDVQTNRDVLVRVLERVGVETDAADSGSQALVHAHAHPPTSSSWISACP